jgi:hypothetical protein
MKLKHFIIICSLVLLLPDPSFTQGKNNDLTAWWQFEVIEEDGVIESVSQVKSELIGFQKLIDGAQGKGLLFDGYTTYVASTQDSDVRITGGFTIEAWISFQAYPWNWVAIVDKQKDDTAGYNLSVDANGFLRFQVAVDGQLRTVKSSQRMELLKWYHLAGSFNPGKGLTIYINGQAAGSLPSVGDLSAATDIPLWIGRSHQKLPPAYPIRLDLPASYSFDGIIDEVKIYNVALSGQEILRNYSGLKPDNEKGLVYRKLPAGPAGPGRFGAYYTKLDFSETWDHPWRVGPYADVIVRFDEAGYKFVFWRGTSYIPFWVTENGIWYTNEFNETWGEDVMGCAEPMSDKQTRHSHVRIIENNDARVIIHWRYALVDNRGVIAKTDPLTGWGDWSDEYYTIYPDGVGLRKIHLWSSQPTEPHQFQEAIILNPPGTRPEDNIEVEAVKMMNMNGETHTYSWAEGAPEKIDKPEKANIQFVNLKSKAIPFVIVNERKPSVTRRNIETEGPWLRPYSGEIIKEHSIFPWWNHWPVAQIPSDGRWASEPDRVSHTSLSNDFEWGELELTDRTHVRVMMHGLTDKPHSEIISLAKSWLYPPPISVAGSSVKIEGYQEQERAYVLDKTGSGSDQIDIDISSSAESPLVNPAFIIKNWGDTEAELVINGDKVPRGKDFRYGFLHNLDGSDLIVWLKYQTTNPLEISLIPRK